MTPLNSEPVLVKDINPGREGSFFRELIEFQNNVWFSGWNGEEWELWKSDGTEAGTIMLDVATEIPTSSQPEQLKVVGEQLYFEAWSNNWRDGRELMVSGGTLGDTKVIEDINAGSHSAKPRDLTEYDYNLYFSAVDYGFINEKGRHLWSSNGNSTRKISDDYILHSKLDADESLMTVFNGELYFVAETLFDGTSLWKYDGSTISPVFDARPESVEDSKIDNFQISGNHLFFTAESEDTGRELYATDGATAQLVKDIKINSSSAVHHSNPNDLVDINGRLYFSAQDSAHGRELWRSDGTEEGTRLIADIRPNSRSTVWGPKYLTNANGNLFFSSTSDDDQVGNELWMHNTQTNQTFLIKDINKRPLASSIDKNFNEPFLSIGDSIIFAADDGIHGNELWFSDGTPEGTQLIADLNPGKSGSNPVDLTLVNDFVYFNAETAELGRELYRLSIAPNNDDTTSNSSDFDDDRNGLVDSTSYYKIYNSNSSLYLTSKTGEIYSKQTSKNWKITKIAATDNGYKALIQGLRSKDGYFKTWDVNPRGVAEKSSRWKSSQQALRKGWESIFGDMVQKDDVIGIPIQDLNKDGFVDQPYSFSIYSEGNAIFIRSGSGKRYKQASTKTWQASQAIETSSGFAILLQGLNKRDGQFQRWDLDPAGKKENKSRWLTTEKALGTGWEQEFGDVILADQIIGQPIMDSNADGLVDQSLQLTLFNNNQPIRIKKNNGREITHDESSHWHAIKAVERMDGDGFQLLVQGSGKKQGKFQSWQIDESGHILERSSWKLPEQAIEDEWHAIFNMKSSAFNDSSPV